jgi:hypothetical protein
MPKRRPIGLVTTPEGKQYPVKILSARATKAAFRPYAVELGQLAIAWNQLHHNLALLFKLLLRAESDVAAGAIWYATDNDFTQRKMLRAIVETDQNSPPAMQKILPAHREEILWILDQTDSSLRHKRNNALHAPLMLLRGVYDDAVRSWVEAHFNPQNPRARPLRGKDLIEEFRDYTALADVLGSYANVIWHTITFSAVHPLPERPLLPEAHKKKQTTHRGKRRPPPHLRGPSQG